MEREKHFHSGHMIHSKDMNMKWTNNNLFYYSRVTSPGKPSTVDYATNVTERSELGIYKRKQEKRKHTLDQESDQENNKEKKEFFNLYFKQFYF